MSRLRLPRRTRRPLSAGPRSPVLAGVITVLVLSLVSGAILFKDALPGRGGTELNAVVEDLGALKSGAPVRVAGVNVGKVTGIDAGPGRMSTIRMTLNDEAPTVRRDAELKIRPRIFLEGNFLVDLHPGTPGRDAMPAGGTISASRTTLAVQIDRVIGTLDHPTRERVQQAIRGYGGGISGDATVAAMRRLIADAPPSLRSSAIVSDASRGQQPGDLASLVDDLGELSEAIAPHAGDLEAAVRGIDRTFGAFAAQQAALRQVVARLPGTLGRSDRLSAAMDRALPPVRRLADALTPGVRELPETIALTRPWARAMTRLASQPALGGWVRDMRAAVPDLVGFAEDATESAPGTEEVARCVADVLVPAGNKKIEDGRFTHGVENYKSYFYGLVGANGESQNFTGTGISSRIGIGLGPSLLQFGTDSTIGRIIKGAPPAGSFGVRPIRPARRPPFRDDVACSTQPVPEPNEAESAVGVG